MVSCDFQPLKEVKKLSMVGCQGDKAEALPLPRLEAGSNFEAKAQFVPIGSGFRPDWKLRTDTGNFFAAATP
jgi:hypothetical protein